jgi:hypothetical protein
MNDETKAPNDSAASERVTRTTHPRTHRPRALGRRYFTTEAAAEKLDTSPQALRARCRRHARSENGEVVARLGMGVVGRKFGPTWRVYFTDAEDSADAT